MAMFRIVYATRFFRDPAADPADPKVSTELRWVLQAVHHGGSTQGRKPKAGAGAGATNGHGFSHGIDVFCVSPVSLCQFLFWIFIIKDMFGDFVLVTTVKDGYDLPGP